MSELLKLALGNLEEVHHLKVHLPQKLMQSESNAKARNGWRVLEGWATGRTSEREIEA